MRTQINIPQIKEQEKSSEKQLNEMETSNLPDREFKNSGYKDVQRSE